MGCAICGEPGAGQRIAGVSLCDTCFSGDFGHHLGRHGVHLQELRYDLEDREHSSIGHFVETCATLDRALELDATFSPQGRLTRWLGSSHVRTGDADFDRAVLVKTPRPERAARILEHAGVRAAILDNVFELAAAGTGGELRIQGHRCRLWEQLDHARRGAGLEDRRRLAVLFLHLAEWAAASGLPTNPALAAFPDLEGLGDALSRGRLLHVSFHRTTLPHLTGLAFLQAMGAGDAFPSFGLHGCRVVSGDFTPLRTFDWLQRLQLEDLPDLGDLSWLPRLASLQVLNLAGSPVGDLSPLATLTDLQILTCGHTAVQDCAPLARLPRLRGLSLGWTRITDLSPLAGLTALEELNISDLAVDLSPLFGMPRLRKLWIRDGRVDPAQLDALRGHLPALRIDPP
ncbi:MAG: hypothetical protein ABIO70_31420 [Pseudomonadota bacterium]